jgi:hypothetical protein
MPASLIPYFGIGCRSTIILKGIALSGLASRNITIYNRLNTMSIRKLYVAKKKVAGYRLHVACCRLKDFALQENARGKKDLFFSEKPFCKRIHENNNTEKGDDSDSEYVFLQEAEDSARPIPGFFA